MRGRGKLTPVLALVAFGFPAGAETLDRPTRGEMLAWHIEAYVPCQEGVGIGEISSQAFALEASRDEIVRALTLLKSDATACSALKATSKKLLALADEDPKKFDLAFGFETVEIETVTAEQEPVPILAQTDIIQPERLKPPQASVLKTRSSY